VLAAGLAHKEANSAGRTVVVADFRFHWLRHTAISLMARAGMKPELIADRVGHRGGGGLIYRRYRDPVPVRDAHRGRLARCTRFGRFVEMGAPGIEPGTSRV